MNRLKDFGTTTALIAILAVLWVAMLAVLDSCADKAPPKLVPQLVRHAVASTKLDAGSSTGGTRGVLTPCESACDNLVRLGCQTYFTLCFRSCKLHTSDARFTQNMSCYLTATTKAQVQKCGPAACR